MPEKDFPLHPFVTNIIKILFGMGEHESVTEILLEECNSESLRTTNKDSIGRIQLAVLKLGNGNIEKFLDAIHTSQIDWRDVLVLAGFGDDLKAHLKWVNEIKSLK